MAVEQRPGPALPSADIAGGSWEPGLVLQRPAVSGVAGLLCLLDFDALDLDRARRFGTFHVCGDLRRLLLARL